MDAEAADAGWYAETAVQTARFAPRARDGAAGAAPPPLPTLDGRVFRSTGHTTGDVDSSTRFDYGERDGVIWADYAGGDVLRGHLIGTRQGHELTFRYVHLRTDRTTAAGTCTSQLHRLADGRLALRETWRWESQNGSGTSLLEEDRPAQPAARPAGETSHAEATRPT